MRIRIVNQHIAKISETGGTILIDTSPVKMGFLKRIKVALRLLLTGVMFLEIDKKVNNTKTIKIQARG